MDSKKTANEKKVTLTLFKGSGIYSEDVHVIVNGKAYIIKRGEPVVVPECVAEILKQQERQLSAAEQITKA